MNRLWMVVAALALAGCEGPGEVVSQYHLALAEGRGEKAFSLLSHHTREELTRRAKAAHDASGGAVSADPTKMIDQGDPSLYPYPEPSVKVAEVKVLKVEGSKAQVEVAVAGKKSEVAVVRENGRWKIDLPLAGEKP
jgi:hypothetical protein